jgi:hypothetical protein
VLRKLRFAVAAGLRLACVTQLTNTQLRRPIRENPGESEAG